jgi:hypothetical protein
MPFLRVEPDDAVRVAQAVELLNTARRTDDPDAVELLTELTAANLRYGWDLEPEEMYLYAPGATSRPVGVLELDFPTRDNVHLTWAALTVHPAHRRRASWLA